MCGDNQNVIELMEAEYLQKTKIFCWAIKELYFSSQKGYLNDLTYKKLEMIYEKSQNYIQKDSVLDLLNYFIKSLKNEAEDKAYE